MNLTRDCDTIENKFKYLRPGITISKVFCKVEKKFF